VLDNTTSYKLQKLASLINLRFYFSLVFKIFLNLLFTLILLFFSMLLYFLCHFFSYILILLFFNPFFFVLLFDLKILSFFHFQLLSFTIFVSFLNLFFKIIRLRSFKNLRVSNRCFFKTKLIEYMFDYDILLSPNFIRLMNGSGEEFRDQVSLCFDHYFSLLLIIKFLFQLSILLC